MPNAKQFPQLADSYWLHSGQPSGTFATPFPQWRVNEDQAAALTTAVMTGVTVPLLEGDVVSTISVFVGATAAGTPTHSWAALYDTASTRNLLAQSTDGATAAIPANGQFDFTLATPQLITKSGVYLAAVCVVASTVPSLASADLGLAVFAGAIGGGTALAQSSGSSLTTTAPATWASPASVRHAPYIVVH